MAQGMAGAGAATPGEVVAALGAVQAQDYGAAKWALGLRLAPPPTDQLVERALDDAAVLRAHALRGTWQLMAPPDIRWILALVAPRLVASYAGRYRQLGLDAATFRRSNAALLKALRPGQELTRAELATALASAGVSTAGQRLAYLLQRAELDALICGGARRRKQLTYALLDRRAPTVPRPLERSQALAELSRRYFHSRGPATVEDFIWWSGLAPSDARAGLESVRATLIPEVLDGTTYWRPDSAALTAASPTAHLLPAFDEYLVAYRDRGAVLDPAYSHRLNPGGGMLNPCVVLDGRVVGMWRRTLARDAITVEIGLFQPVTRSGSRAITDAAGRYGAFLGLSAKATRIRIARQ
jgi:hypothetical protein